ncbi:thymidylate kinase [Bacillus halotolerans]|nr:thymidylate kinase [Bacillus halotolerans]PRS03227.1 thymidylate kinase [Bacillus halotolerans]PRS19900.1 thymidylate kinase [Bacillus halotolerans]QDK67971.1 thymidylate kinase [Bacillus halotolerans]
MNSSDKFQNLLLHVHNPADFFPWGETFEKAKYEKQACSLVTSLNYSLKKAGENISPA